MKKYTLLGTPMTWIIIKFFLSQLPQGQILADLVYGNYKITWGQKVTGKEKTPTKTNAR